MRKKTVGLLLVMVILFSLVGQGLFAEGQKEAAKPTYPTKNIDMTVLFQAGQAGDVIGRKAADLANRHLPKPIISNNRLGGGGAVGYQYVLGQPADGYNIVWNSTSINVAYHQGNMPVDKGWDAFRGVANLTMEASGLAIRGDDNRWNTFEEFVAYAKAHPNELTISNSGVGSFNHLAAEAITGYAGIKVKHIPMDAGQSIASLLGGKVDAMVNMTFDISQHAKAGTMKPLVVIAPKRLAVLPNTPTMKELGYDIDIQMYRGIAVHKDTPDYIVDVLEEAFMKAGNDPEFREFAETKGATIDVRNAKDFNALMAKDDATVAQIMEQIGMLKQ
ncbi:MAG: tripartite tricarboxylate transporter substrate binding protein [Sphaerochaetaceae bacterium]